MESESPQLDAIRLLGGPTQSPVCDTMIDLDRARFRVAQTATVGVVSADTWLEFQQRGTRLVGRYGGGTIVRGCLVGEASSTGVVFRYAQREQSGELHSGQSSCVVSVGPDGRRLLHEHFRWETRSGTGTNVFEETEATS